MKHSANKSGRSILILAAAVTAALAGTARGQTVTVYGGLTYNQTTGDGFHNAGFGPYGVPLNDNGVAIGVVDKFVGGVHKGPAGQRWDSGGSVTELATLGSDASGIIAAVPQAINLAGQIAGYSEKYVGGVDKGNRAVRWDTSGAIVELGNLGLDPGGETFSRSHAINLSGQIAGTASKYVGGVYSGTPAVRWSASGAPLELGNLGVSLDGDMNNAATAINPSGVTSGYAEKYVSGEFLGTRAVRWNASGAVLELGNLGTDPDEHTDSESVAINTAGQIAGVATKYVGGISKGPRGVRWDASGAALELGVLGTDASGNGWGYALSINNAGQTAGIVEKYQGGAFVGMRGVRWNAAGTPLELPHLGVGSNGVTHTDARWINASGQVAGSALTFSGGSFVAEHATVWNADGSVVDLNSLVSFGSGWVLTQARSISDSGWVAGLGQFDPDAGGPLDPYQRHFLISVAPANEWRNPGGGSWHTGANWSNSIAPGTASDAVFAVGTGGGYTVTVSSSTRIQNLLVPADELTVNITAGQTLAVSGAVRVGDNGTSQLTIAGSGKLELTDLHVRFGSTMTLAAGSARTLKVSSLMTSATSKLDLKDNKLIVAGGDIGTSSGSGDYDGVTGKIQSAANGGAWDGGGITTSMPDAAVGLTSLAIATADQTG
ncbi:MAG: hypothetical protein QOE14_2420 [Humisphaera sp.]|nr:hypothetical protein [Humisphaera sp.]